jgi:DNA-binding NarL/FixJ family response regulator
LAVNSARAALQASIARLERALADLPGAAPARPEDEAGSTAQAGPPRLRLQDWRVVETMSAGTTDYVLLCRTRAPRDAFDALTARERDALDQACSGASNKEIAHRMGISDSTVRVLVSRAARKVGAADRNALLQAYRARQPRVDS